MEDQEEVTDTEPREDHRDRLVDKFNHQHELAKEAVITAEDLVEVGNSVDSSEETTVQPATTLENELGHLIWHIGLTSGRLDILQEPSAFAAIFVTVKSIQSEVQEEGFTASDLFTNDTFFSIIVSLGSTYVMWFIASFIFLDPWHMFTSVSILILFYACLVTNISSSSNTSCSRQPTSMFSTFMLSVTPTTSHGVLRETTKPKSCPLPTSSPAARSTSTSHKTTGT